MKPIATIKELGELEATIRLSERARCAAWIRAQRGDDYDEGRVSAFERLAKTIDAGGHWDKGAVTEPLHLEEWTSCEVHGHKFEDGCCVDCGEKSDDEEPTLSDGTPLSPRRKPTREERMQGLADSGIDTWAEKNGER